MPRVTREQADSNRANITDASARLFRERGINGVSVAELMAAAGLTHGGFYRHFESKEALAAEAIGMAFDQSSERWHKRVEGSGDAASARKALVETYLSPAARGSAGAACPAATMARDVAREPEASPVRAAFNDGVEKLVEILASIQHEAETGRRSSKASEADRKQALADLALMVGGLVLAQATSGAPISDEILQAARERLALRPATTSSRSCAR